MPPFCQSGARDSLKIDEKEFGGGGGSNKSSEKQRA